MGLRLCMLQTAVQQGVVQQTAAQHYSNPLTVYALAPNMMLDGQLQASNSLLR